MNLVTWLRQTPQPSSIRADSRPVQIPSGGRKWSNLAETIEALGATRIECLDARGEVIRATDLDQDASPPAKPPADLGDMQCFARLIAEAYEKGTKSYAPLLDSAMQFVENQSQRLAKAEAEIERLRVLNAKLRMDLARVEGRDAGAGGELGALGEVLGPFVSGLLQAHAGAPAAEPAPPANGRKAPA